METPPQFTPDPGLKLMDQVRQILRYHHYAISTERTYCKWILSIDLERGLIYVRRGKGGKDRSVPLPQTVVAKIKSQVDGVKRIHEADVKEGFGEVWLPDAFSRKIGPGARDIGWQYLFPAKKRSIDPRSGKERRQHVLASGLQKAVRSAGRGAGLTKTVTCHTFRHSYATHLLENGVNIRLVQALMGHADVKTTEIYTHVMQKDVSAAVSPLDSLHKPPP